MKQETQLKYLAKFLREYLKPMKPLPKSLYDKLMKCDMLSRKSLKDIERYYMLHARTKSQRGGDIIRLSSLERSHTVELDEESHPKLGDGGYGVVYKLKQNGIAEDDDLVIKVIKVKDSQVDATINNIIAVKEQLKLIDAGGAPYQIYREIFKRDHIIPDSWNVGYTMPLLNELNRGDGKLMWLKNVFMSAISRLNVVHKHGIIHLDLKLGNLMEKNNNIVITDYDGSLVLDKTQLKTYLQAIDSSQFGPHCFTHVFAHPFVVQIFEMIPDTDTQHIDVMSKKYSPLEQARRIWNMSGGLEFARNGVNPAINPVVIHNALFGNDYEPFLKGTYNADDAITQQKLVKLLKFCDVYSLAFSVLYEAHINVMDTNLTETQKANVKAFTKFVLIKLAQVARALGLDQKYINHATAKGGHKQCQKGSGETLTLVDVMFDKHDYEGRYLLSTFEQKQGISEPISPYKYANAQIKQMKTKETSIEDEKQSSTFGCYKRGELIHADYKCVTCGMQIETSEINELHKMPEENYKQ